LPLQQARSEGQFFYIMSSQYIVVLCLLMLIWGACQTNPKSVVPVQFEGQWINTDFCARVKQHGSVVEAINRDHLPYAYTLVYSLYDPDSITCFTRQRQWKLPVRGQADTLMLNTPDQKKLFLIYESAGPRLTLIDPSGPNTYTSRWEHTDTTLQGYAAMSNRMNQYLLGGAFRMNGQQELIYWSSNGQIKNWPAFSRYELCTGGGCFVTGSTMDIVQLQPSDGTATQNFGFRMNITRDTLSLYQLIDRGPQQAAAIGPVQYQFFKKK
jgi:hypothetical protein